MSSGTPRIVQKLDPQALRGDRVNTVAAGGAHSGAITRSGKVYCWGFNRSGQTGVATKANTISEPRECNLVNLQEDQSGANGGADTYAVTGQGGQPPPGPPGKPIVLVCGRHHSAMLTDTGAVFTWGATSFGRLGLHDQSTKNVTKPTRVTTLDHFAVHGLASGDFHMLALTRDRRVFSWGYGAEGQCGHGNSLHLRTPRPVEALRHVLVSKIGCGAWYSAAVSADGYLYTWGYGDGGWLGQESPKGESTPSDPSLAPHIPHVPHVTHVPPTSRPTLLTRHNHTNLPTCAGGDAPMVEPGPPSAQKQAETCSFDSAHNNLLPGLVPALANNQVTEVACGGGHLIALSITRPPAPAVPDVPTVDPALLAKVTD